VRGRVPWPQALIVSCVIHCLLLAIVGWAGILSFNPIEAEPFIEVDLVNGVVAQEPSNVNAATTRPLIAVAGKTEDLIRDNRDVSVPDVTTVTLGAGSPAIAVSDATSESTAAGTAIPSGIKAENKGGKLFPPRILQKVEPVYPEEMRRQGTAGTVIVQIEVLENGRSENVSVQRSSGFAALDESALQATRQWRFVPAKDEATGMAVRCYTTLSIVFRLN
jgi:periplasmic protein TonB